LERFESVEDFHRQRRMFFVIQGSLLLPAGGSPLSHSAWLALFMGKAKAERHLADCTRGYCLDGELRAYRGPDFSHEVHAPDVFLAMMAFQGMMPVHTIGFGAVQDPGLIRWPAAVYQNAWRWAGEQMAKGVRA
jgi:hypothetical protein